MADGKRNYAILLLLARLDLRACEIVSLSLDDIDSENGRVSIRSKGGRWAQLPLPDGARRLQCTCALVVRVVRIIRCFFDIERHSWFSHSGTVSNRQAGADPHRHPLRS